MRRIATLAASVIATATLAAWATAAPASADDRVGTNAPPVVATAGVNP